MRRCTPALWTQWRHHDCSDNAIRHQISNHDRPDDGHSERACRILLGVDKDAQSELRLGAEPSTATDAAGDQDLEIPYVTRSGRNDALSPRRTNHGIPNHAFSPNFSPPSGNLLASFRPLLRQARSAVLLSAPRSLAFLDQERKYAAQKNNEFSSIRRVQSTFLFIGAQPVMKSPG